MLNLVGFCGKKRSGKDTCGGLLRANHNFKKVHFASALKEMASKITDVSVEIFEHDTLKSEPFSYPVKLDAEILEKILEQLPLTSPAQVNKISHKVIGYEFNTWRQFLQFLGTDIVRDEVSTTFWVDRAKNKIAEELALGNKVAVCDVRFENEVEAVRSLGGKVYKVERDTDQGEDSHVSEKMDFDVDGIIDNNEDLSTLKKKVFTLIGAE